MFFAVEKLDRLLQDCALAYRLLLYVLPVVPSSNRELMIAYKGGARFAYGTNG